MHSSIKYPQEGSARSVLASLRACIPLRDTTFTEGLRIAELQAARLRELIGIESDEMPEGAIAELPRIHITRRRLPTSGLSYWDGVQWIIAVNESEPETRQRFTLFHEYKHIVDHGSADRLYHGGRSGDAERQAEQAADYFAGCVLMPKRLVKRAWGNGTQAPDRLALLFEVSPRAVEVRLAQLGLNEPADRCSGPKNRRSASSPRGRYYRSNSTPSSRRVPA
jgi:Zn-dependent peptidase ImmA (M78 family)